MNCAAFAYDRALTDGRRYDADGRLHVAMTPISKAAVNSYKGSEIPRWEALGLSPSRIYQLLRAPDELRAAAATFNNLPILSRHVAVTAVDHRPDLVIGATGSDAAFEAPFLTNSLVVWAQDAIDAIESGAQRELSAAYRFTPDMTPGSFEGQRFDGVMRALIGNHISTVVDGRAGSEVAIDGALRSRWASTSVELADFALRYRDAARIGIA